MSDSIPPPVPSALLPQLLAHIPSAITSPTPPESLYPLLAPLLRSRVKLLSSPNNWASLLTWNAAYGPALVSHLSTLDPTPHPSSGELELGRTRLNGIKRLDEETLNASLELVDWGLAVVYTWSTNDPEGEDDAWRVLDVHASSSSCAEDPALWRSTVAAAEEAFSASRSGGGRKLSAAVPPPPLPREPAQGEGDEDDDYWAMYDRSSAATPAARELPNPPTEEAYFSQYDEVEPALDSSIYSGSADSEAHAIATSPTLSPPHAPRPLSARSDGKPTARLEEQALQQTSIQAEVAVKQHISTSLKSLYRLAKQTGIGQEEFAGIINTELSVLSMMDDED